jgi:hypothetical protein
MSQRTAIDFFISLFVSLGLFLQQMPFIKSARAIHMPFSYTQIPLLQFVIIDNYKYKLSKSKFKKLKYPYKNRENCPLVALDIVSCLSSVWRKCRSAGARRASVSRCIIVCCIIFVQFLLNSFSVDIITHGFCEVRNYVLGLMRIIYEPLCLGV